MKPSSPGARARVLVTGVTGFAGGHLAEALLARGDRVVGIARRSGWPAELAHLHGQAELRRCDLSDGPSLEAILREVKPQRIYHLAGYPHVGRSLKEPDAAWAGNLGVTRTLYDAVVRWGGAPRILYVSSGQVYGDAGTPGQVQDERSELRPSSPYAASKAAADLVSYQYTRHPGLDIVRARPFNHIGPRQSPQFAVAHFAQQLAAIERGARPPVLETGNLAPQRDLTDVRDVVAAYVLLMECGRTGAAYNVGSGRSWSMREVLDRLLGLAGRAVEVRQRAELVRSADPPALRVEASRLRQETGWEPRRSLEQTLADTLAYWRGQPFRKDEG